VGYSVYHPDGEHADEEPATAPTPAAVATMASPTPFGGRSRALLVMAAVLCLIAALLAVWL
jgi:hypothetical protein